MPLWLTIALAVAPYVVPPLVGVVAILVKRAEQNLPAQKRELLDQVSRVAVSSVEQTASSVLNGPAKKEQAMQQVAVMLQHLGIQHADPAVISSFVEASVKAIKLTQQAQSEGNVVAHVDAPLSTVPTQANG